MRCGGRPRTGARQQHGGMPSPTSSSAPPSARVRALASAGNASGSAAGAAATGVIALVSLGHGVSHFFHLLIAPLIPWLRDALGLSYTALGFTVSAFFAASAVTQAAAGFWVDAQGPRRAIFFGMGMLALSGVVLGLSNGLAALLFGAALAGIGNGVFHPADYTLLNRRVPATRLGHAYSWHSVAGNVGAAAAPLVLVAVASAWHWRAAFFIASALALVVGGVMWVQRGVLHSRAPDGNAPGSAATPTSAARAPSLAFLKLPALWTCLLFFVFYALAQGSLQTFSSESARALHGLPLALAGSCLTVYLLATAAGTFAGGFLAAAPQHCERNIVAGFSAAALAALSVAVLPLGWPLVVLAFAVIGAGVGVALPSRDLLVKRVAPPGASGRAYGFVYSGIDIGMAAAPALLGAAMDAGHPRWVWLAVALFQSLLIASVLWMPRALLPTSAPTGAARPPSNEPT